MSIRAVLTAPLELELRAVSRYLGYGRTAPDAATQALMERLRPLFLAAVDCRACCLEVPVSVEGDRVRFSGCAPVSSRSLAKNLEGCSSALLFAATIGAAADRQRRYAAVRSPAEAVVLDAMGTAGIEAFCDRLCDGWRQEYAAKGLFLRPRFSPGYGDLPLEFQGTLLPLLDSGRQAGITLTESLLMTPQKSVSAIVGLGSDGCREHYHDCAACALRDCQFRLEGN